MQRAQPPRPVSRAALVLILAAACGLGLLRLSGIEPATAAVERALLDLRFQIRGPVAAPEEVVIVEIDEATVTGTGLMAPLRAALADALVRIGEAGPSVIAIDLLLLEATAADRALAEVLSGRDDTVLATASVAEGGGERARSPELAAAVERSAFGVVVSQGGRRPGEAAPLLLPPPALATVARLGHVNIVRAPDRIARELPLAAAAGDGLFIPALPLAAAARSAKLASGALVLRQGEAVLLGERTIATDGAGRITLNHYGGKGSFATVALGDVLDGTIPGETFEDRAVFIGGTAESLGDVFATPFAADVAGVELLATAYANIVHGAPIRRDEATWIASIAAALALALAASLAAGIGAFGMALAAGGLVWIAAGGLLIGSFAAGGLWLDAVTVLGATLIGSGVGGFLRHRAERRLSDVLGRQRENLAHYVSPALAALLAEDETPALDGRSLEASVLFADIEGFTGLAESEETPDVAAVLNRVHARIGATVEAHGGIVTDFLGDGAMVVFGLPEPSPGDAGRALACAGALAAAGGDIAAPGAGPGGMRLRVSLHRGPVTVAILGSSRQRHLTVTGDTVNVASRMQDSAKAHGLGCAVSGAALAAAEPAERARFRHVARDPLRGRRGEVDIWTPRA